MKLGLVVRSEDRGLGSLGRDFHTNLQPDKTLLVLPANARRHGLVSHPEWFPDATLVRYDGRLHERTCREWLDGLDVALMFETAYDWRFCRWAAAAHVATVCMAMPEWWRPAWADLPTQWWAPTSWRLDRLPPKTRLVPVPVPRPPHRLDVGGRVVVENVTHHLGPESPYSGNDAPRQGYRGPSGDHVVPSRDSDGYGDDGGASGDVFADAGSAVQSLVHSGQVPTPARTEGPFRWLHVAGARLPDEATNADRNGTQAVLQAALLVRELQEIVVRSQSPLAQAEGVTVVQGSVENRRDLYSEADALILPRRYAGLSLPVLEAMSVGLPVVMTDLAPQNRDWPVRTVSTRPGLPHRLCSLVETGDADPRALASVMDLWATNPTETASWADASKRYAERNSWMVRGPEIRVELERAADLVVA